MEDRDSIREKAAASIHRVSITEYLLDHLLLFLSVILLFQSHVQRKFTKAVALQQLSKCRNRIA